MVWPLACIPLLATPYYDRAMQRAQENGPEAELAALFRASALFEVDTGGPLIEPWNNVGIALKKILPNAEFVEVSELRPDVVLDKIKNHINPVL